MSSIFLRTSDFGQPLEMDFTINNTDDAVIISCDRCHKFIFNGARRFANFIGPAEFALMVSQHECPKP